MEKGEKEEKMKIDIARLKGRKRESEGKWGGQGGGNRMNVTHSGR